VNNIQNLQFQEEKISARKQGRSQVNMEKSSKNLISVFGEKPARGLPKPPPTPPCRESAKFVHGENAIPDADAESRSGIGTRRKGKGEENNAKLNNSSTEQHFGAIFYTKIDIPFLLLILLTKCAYLLLASLASKNCVMRAEPIKGSPS
jgi:hypothetical protein